MTANAEEKSIHHCTVFLYTGPILSLSTIFRVPVLFLVCTVQSLLNDSTQPFLLFLSPPVLYNELSYTVYSLPFSITPIPSTQLSLFSCLLSFVYPSYIAFHPFPFGELHSLSSPPSSLVCWVCLSPFTYLSFTFHLPFYLPFFLPPPVFLPLGFALSDLSEAPDRCLFPAGSHQRDWPDGRNSDCILLVLSFSFLSLLVLSVLSVLFISLFRSCWLSRARSLCLWWRGERRFRGTRCYFEKATDRRCIRRSLGNNVTVTYLCCIVCLTAACISSIFLYF